MKVVKRINNNVAVCQDGNGKELVAFGTGIGFPKTPYELTDLNKIQMTFYQMDAHSHQLLQEIPENVFDISTQIVTEARKRIRRPLNPNMVFSLADHINFAIIRQRDYADMKLPFSYDVQHLYPDETSMGKYAVQLINKQLNVKLPKSEATAIAMHFVNSQSMAEMVETTNNTESLITDSVSIIEESFNIQIDKTSFTYNRFSMHLRYYIKRAKEHQQIVDDDVDVLFTTMKSELPDVYDCAKKIANRIDKVVFSNSGEGEIFYLMIYIRRIFNNAKTKQKDKEK